MDSTTVAKIKQLLEEFTMDFNGCADEMIRRLDIVNNQIRVVEQGHAPSDAEPTREKEEVPPVKIESDIDISETSPKGSAMSLARVYEQQFLAMLEESKAPPVPMVLPPTTPATSSASAKSTDNDIDEMDLHRVNIDIQSHARELRRDPMDAQPFTPQWQSSTLWHRSSTTPSSPWAKPDQI